MTDVLKPQVSYAHTLSELSVNRKDPCEIIRELVSNSYDAKARHIKIYPLMQYEGFVFFDDGEGIKTEKSSDNHISPWVAFFSIGVTTKIKGASIGYKCQGSKLCFASRKFALITRSISNNEWKYFELDNPKKNLCPEKDITPKSTPEPWKDLRELLSSPSPDVQTESILKSLDQAFFESCFSKQGTMVIVLGYEASDFSRYFNTSGLDSDKSDLRKSYLYNYIRFNTKYGDVKVIDKKNGNFDPVDIESFKSSVDDVKKLSLEIWESDGPLHGKLVYVDLGYPYLPKTQDADGPATVSSLKNGRFSDRFARVRKIAGKPYHFVFAIDGWRRAREGYEFLARQGSRRSGISLYDQRGVFLCCHGIKICPFNDIFDATEIEEKYSNLGSGDSQKHFSFFIDGDFDLVTNRNSLSASSDELVKSREFVTTVRDLLDEFYRKSSIFKDLVNRINRSTESPKLRSATEALESAKRSLMNRERFMIKGVEALKEQWIISPIPGEEHGLGLLYGLLSYLIPADSDYQKFWLHPKTFSGVGIDSLGIKVGSSSIGENDILALEYKYNFQSPYNHPLILTDMILCWEAEMFQPDYQIDDDYGYRGFVKDDDELENFGYRIVDIQDKNGNLCGKTITVISLKQLIRKTFSIDRWIEKAMEQQVKKKTRSRKRSGE